MKYGARSMRRDGDYAIITTISNPSPNEARQSAQNGGASRRDDGSVSSPLRTYGRQQHDMPLLNR